MTTIDFGRAATRYARHRAGFPPAFYDLLIDWGVLDHDAPIRLHINHDVAIRARRDQPKAPWAPPSVRRPEGERTVHQTSNDPHHKPSVHRPQGERTVHQTSNDPHYKPSLVLDIGTGTGAVALELARRGLRVTGLDPSAALLAQARRLADEESLDVALVEGRAEALPLPDASCRLITAAQCWHWFDRPRAAAECARVLAPGGALVIAHMDFLSAHSLLVSDTLDLVRQIGGDPTPGALRLGVNGVYPHWFADLHDAGFTRLTSRSFDIDIPYTHRDWVGRMVASAGVGGSRPPEDVARFEALLRARLANEPIMLQRSSRRENDERSETFGRRAAEPIVHIPHRVFAIAGWRAH